MIGSEGPPHSGLPDGVAASDSAPAPGQTAPVGYAVGIACAAYVGVANGSFLVGGMPVESGGCKI